MRRPDEDPTTVATQGRRRASEERDQAAGGAGADCLTEDEVLTYARGSVPPAVEEVIRRHLYVCPACCVLVAEAVRSIAGTRAGTSGSAPASISAALTLTPGETLLDRYRIVRFLARGGMGEVYEASDSVLHETVALKTLVCTALDSSAAMNRFMDEVRTARQVTHPNICRILEFGIHRPSTEPSVAVPFLTMEFLAGETLAARIARQGRLAPAEVARLLPQIVAGVSAIHAAGIVHRDIKPGNIVLLPGPPERVVVTDFGLARMLDPDPHSSAETGPFVVGTVDYMSPEQIDRKPPNQRFDVYALGVVIFEMLTGRKPFSAATPVALAVERLRRAAPAPSQFVPGLDRGWDELCARCLAADPDRRLQRVEDILAPPVTGRWAGNRRARALTAALVGALLIAAIAVPLLRRGDGGGGMDQSRRVYPAEAEVTSQLARRPADAPPARALERLIAASGCSADMVAVAGRFCIDRYEASTVEDVQERALSPDYPPWAPLARFIRDDWSERLRAGKAGSSAALPALESFQLEDRWRPRAVSQRLAIPQSFVNRPVAAAACANAGKRLCSEAEWKTACRGERNTRFPYGDRYEPRACNVYGEAHPAIVLYGIVSEPLDDPRLNRVGFRGKQLLRKTGDPEFERCRSRWGDDGAFDMVGNLDEWVDSPEVVFVGGHHARDSTDGCEYRNARHKKEGGAYFNYSIGFRCCDSLRLPGSRPP